MPPGVVPPRRDPAGRRAGGDGPVGLSTQPHGRESGFELPISGVCQQPQAGGHLAAGIVEALLPGRQLGKRAMQQPVEPAIAHLVAPGPCSLEALARQVVVATVDGQCPRHQGPGDRRDRGLAAPVGRSAGARLAGPQQAIGLVPAPQLVEGGGADAAHQ
jgi:hypothetical protein